MSFISYAQNLEDVMLYRALKNIEHGFYIDVGALYPDIASVTKAFYDRGWRGINIEPIPECFRLLQNQRSGDINLNLAISNRQGQLILHEIVNTPGDTTANKFNAEKHSLQGHEVRSLEVPCTTLDVICAENKVETVHFLKIDVEGSEKEVLEGFSFDKIRPWIVVIEANEPNSTKDVSNQWESLITNKNYECVYYDGLNRFYLAREYSDINVHFRTPPNVFDNYIRSSEYLTSDDLAKTRMKVESLKTQLVTERSKSQDLEYRLTSEQSKSRELESQLAHFKGSISWRITSPLRSGRDGIARLLSFMVKLIKNLIKMILRFMFRFRWLVRLGTWILKDQPGIRAQIGSVRTLSSEKTKPVKNKSEIFNRLSESARPVYSALKDSYNNNSNKKDRLNK